MATFKVGQRVRLIQHREVSKNVIRRNGPGLPLRAEGTVEFVFLDHGPLYAVRFDGFPSGAKCEGAYAYLSGDYGCFGHEIAPLTDPRADEFIADMERFAVLSKPKEEATVPR